MGILGEYTSATAKLKAWICGGELVSPFFGGKTLCSFILPNSGPATNSSYRRDITCEAKQRGSGMQSSKQCRKGVTNWNAERGNELECGKGVTTGMRNVGYTNTRYLATVDAFLLGMAYNTLNLLKRHLR